MRRATSNWQFDAASLGRLLEAGLVAPTKRNHLSRLPGEVFVELGIEIKRASPFETTLVVELTNDAPGYVPTKKAFAEGSYETVNSRAQSGGGEMMVKTAVRLLKDLAGNLER